MSDFRNSSNVSVLVRLLHERCNALESLMCLNSEIKSRTANINTVFHLQNDRNTDHVARLIRLTLVLFCAVTIWVNFY